MKTIKLYEFVSTYPSYRLSADKLFDFIKNNSDDKIIVDFSNVEGVTHSFASQYRIDKKYCSKDVKEINMGDNVKKMFKSLNNKKTDEQGYVEIQDFNPRFNL